MAAASAGIATGALWLAGITPSEFRWPSRPRATTAAALPAGTTAAVLSFVDAASNAVEVVRHWPAAPEDVMLSPYVPYFWDGCPGAGAIIMLITGPPAADALARGVAVALEAGASRRGALSEALARIIAALRTPGSVTAETLKTAAPFVSDLAEYERDGYAVFLFVRWTGTWCSVAVQAVPEGYGIPFIR
ncbi:MAG TPA: hypothetical protein VEP50_06165 [bacterium]|nr:hypothetical protein [bacterium]